MDVLEELDYPNPPVVEVALSVQFDKLLQLDAARIGLYWTLVRNRFPFAEQHAPLPPVHEVFGPPEALPRALRIEFTEAVPTPRFWLLNDDRSQLLQIQDDRFSHNWRKRVQPYPHYEAVRDIFSDELRAFDSFLRDQGLGGLVPTQCEVTYINHIPVPHDSSQADVGALLTTWTSSYNSKLPISLEDAFIHLRYAILGADGSHMGRVHVDVQPAFSQDDRQPIWVLSLTARGRPIGEGTQGALNFLNLGREHVLATFVAVTNTSRQKEWESK